MEHWSAQFKPTRMRQEKDIKPAPCPRSTRSDGQSKAIDTHSVGYNIVMDHGLTFVFNQHSPKPCWRRRCLHRDHDDDASSAQTKYELPST